MNRKAFLKSGIFGISGLAIGPAFGGQIFQNTKENISKNMIKDFVVAGHNDLDTVKSMLQKEPNLIYSRHDWGGGDFEEAIEGAGHVGNEEIANYLIEQGARVNLFVLTMLGKDKIVIPALEEYPDLITAKGPHGFSLLHHAKIGGVRSKKILEYLEEKGLKQSKFEI